MPYASLTYALPFASGSDTSHDAAVAARAFAGTQSQAVLRWFQAQGNHGSTQRECSEGLGIGRPSVCARVRELELGGRLVKTRERRQGRAIWRPGRRELGLPVESLPQEVDEALAAAILEFGGDAHGFPPPPLSTRQAQASPPKPVRKSRKAKSGDSKQKVNGSGGGGATKRGRVQEEGRRPQGTQA